MAKGYFITGTDTGVGKTWATVALMEHFKAQGKSVIGMKPVASGCDVIAGKLVNVDALLLQQHASITVDYDDINSYAYELPVSPHLAGKNNPADFTKIRTAYSKLANYADLVLVEGAGGWYSPLNNEQDNSDLALVLELPVILVVAIRLGCINQAKLTYQAIKAANAACAGWVAVCNDEGCLLRQENIESIQAKTEAPLLGCLPYQKIPDFNALAACYSLAKLRGR